MIDGEKIGEVTQEPETQGQMFMSVKEFEKLVRSEQKLKTKKKMQKVINELIGLKDYWLERSRELEKERDDLRKNLDEAKAQLNELLGIRELEQVKLQELHFEKGVANAEQT